MVNEGEIRKLVSDAEKQIAAASSREEIEKLKVSLLGRKSALSGKIRSISALGAAERKKAGAVLNSAKKEIERSLREKAKAIGDEAGVETQDVTLPGRRTRLGSIHPVTLTIRSILEILRGFGFEATEGPEVESDYNNFVALNTPPDHPARDLQATYYIEKERLLRTQTSAVWPHVLGKRPPPFRIAAPGRAFRRDAIDATHSPVFHQVEGLWVDENCSFSDLKGVIGEFLLQFFGPETKSKFAPSYFPFTEPSAEVLILCRKCGGSGCAACGRSGWLEVMGSGMVHPNILSAAGLDSTRYRGFAFGMGVERLAMLKFGIADIRWFYENDLRILSQVRS